MCLWSLIICESSSVKSPAFTLSHTHTELSPNVRYDVFVSSETDITSQINMTLLLERGVMLSGTTPVDSSPSPLSTGVIAAIVIIVVLVIAGLLAALLVVFLC